MQCCYYYQKFCLGIFSLLIFSCCHLTTHTMTAPLFDKIEIGSSLKEVELQAGPPYRLISRPNGDKDYCYLERIQIGPNSTAQNIYILTIRNGYVVNKDYSNEAQNLHVQIR